MRIKAHIPGLLAIGAIAVFSTYLSTLHASFDALVISIIFGMFFGNILGDRGPFREGTELVIKVFLPVGIALYGAQLSVTGMKAGMFLSIFLVFISLFCLTYFLARLFHLNSSIMVLLASGLSICGASAIAVISPLIGARREDTSISILSVMMLGLTGMIFYPLLYDLFSLSQDEFTFFAGTTLPMIGQVKVAAANVCAECPDSALQIKLVRVALLFFLVPLAVYLSKKEEKKFRVPWFAVAFVVLSFLANVTPLLKDFLEPFKSISSFCLSAGLASIGFSVEIDDIVQQGMTPLGVVVSSWSIVIIALYLLRNIF